ncbi:MAG: peptide chain release factor aRF-1 [Candidatus Hodarchaeota archaeon]
MGQTLSAGKEKSKEETESSFRKYRLKKQLEVITKKQSQDGSTCLVSLYIPPNRVLSDFVRELSEEIGTAANIRSKTTRKNVVSALQAINGRLRIMGQKSPESGYVIFGGVTTSGKNELYVLAPPDPVSRKLYVCDSYFHTKYLEENLQDKDEYGLIALDGSIATIASLRGSYLEILKTTRSGAVKKHRAGGQSSVRFQRLHEEAVQRFLKRVADLAKDLFIEKGDREIKGVLIGGPGPTKDHFAKDGFLDPRLQEIVVGSPIDTSYAGDAEGIRDLIAKGQDRLKGVRLLEEKALVQKFLDNLYKDTGLISYGEAEVRQLLNSGAVHTLLLSDGVDLSRVQITCESCENVYSQTTADTTKLEQELSGAQCQKCGSSLLQITEVEDLVENLGKLAEEIGAKVEIISAQTEEGAVLLNFGGIAALLRYKQHL